VPLQIAWGLRTFLFSGANFHKLIFLINWDEGFENKYFTEM